MAKRQNVSISVINDQQAWRALGWPGLSKTGKLNLIKFLADIGNPKSARRVRRGDLCKGLPGQKALEQRFFDILLAVNDVEVLIEEFGIETNAERKAELLDRIALRAQTSFHCLLAHAAELSPEDQVRLAKVAMGTELWQGRGHKLMEKYSGAAPALRAFLIAFVGRGPFGTRFYGSYVEKMLRNTVKYFPESAPLTSEERRILVQNFITDEEMCGHLLMRSKYQERAGPHGFTDEEMLMVIPAGLSFITKEEADSWAENVLSDEKLLALCSEEQRAQFASVVEAKAA